METIRVVFRHPKGKPPLTLELPRDTRFSALTPLLYERERIGEEGTQIFRQDRLIGINCGCVYGGRLGCICLDTFAEYYV